MGVPRKRQGNNPGQNTESNEVIGGGGGSGARRVPFGERSSPIPRRIRPVLVRRRILIALALISLIYIGLIRDVELLRFGNQAIDNLALSLCLRKQFDVVIIDAGSTASRVLVFTFHKSILNGKLVLDDELFVEKKPGLSAFAKEPYKVRQSLEELLDHAKKRVPKNSWAHTPLILRATAGLRLLPGHEAQNILAESRRVVKASGFLVEPDAVEIMHGTDEGLFSWFSVNFLADRFSSLGNSFEYASNTVAALDLGGGSTQLTFALTPAELEHTSTHKDQLKHVNAFGRNLTLFTQSFLGLGLMAARKAIFTHQDNQALVGQLEQQRSSSKSIELRAECVNPIIVKAPWSYGGQNYLISGPLNGSNKIIKAQSFASVDDDLPIVRLPTCLKIIQKVVNASIPHDLPSLRNHEIYAFSYYFERAVEVGLIDSFEGGEVTLESFYKAAERVCQDPNTDQPFICLDLSFIYVLLHDGFGLNDATQITLLKKISGHELSWALGAAFNMLDLNS
ncbi:ectonucleoside triphosphate diphosphohydrolase 5 [Copidosoma floridanum]|uniref:ectonucleoside triphosphate diphosphohydrolase 5 n=1 Tax=Copidosoma floridanum TaxID=29053 RepID=UPI0006C9E457|nr:ectonucleoside triphosphate diphosphohydrolase 5 [Copidosoma floridanum]